mgnify:FL=1
MFLFECLYRANHFVGKYKAIDSITKVIHRDLTFGKEKYSP